MTAYKYNAVSYRGTSWKHKYASSIQLLQIFQYPEHKILLVLHDIPLPKRRCTLNLEEC